MDCCLKPVLSNLQNKIVHSNTRHGVGRKVKFVIAAEILHENALRISQCTKE
jgi:hypothetical protein